MNKYLLTGAVVIILLIAGFFWLNGYIYDEKQADVAADYKDAEYVIGMDRIQLHDGVATMPAAEGSASTITTRYFGNEVRGDLDGDGDEDVVFILTQDGSGSGTFFYLAGAIKVDGGYRGTQAVFIGDRIAPQTTEFRDGQVVVNYADRAPGEPMTAQPSVGKSLYLKYDSESLSFGEVVQGFEGEADPSRMTLGMKTWVWQSAEYGDGREVKPERIGDFTLTFGDDGTMHIGTDCNSMSAAYDVMSLPEKEGDALSIGSIASTKKYCEGSQESVFAALLADAREYRFTSRGELIIELEDGGTMTLR